MYFCGTKQKNKMKNQHPETPTRLFDIMACATPLRSKHTCFEYRGESLSASAYRKQVDGLSNALLQHNLQRGEVVALVSGNRPEWNVVDMAVMQVGGVLLPLGKGLSAEEYVDCLNGAGVRILFVEDDESYRRFRLLLPQVETLRNLVSLDSATAEEDLANWIAEGMRHMDAARLERRRNLVTTDDVCTLAYVGSGVCNKLTHRFVLLSIQELLANDVEEAKLSTPNCFSGDLSTLFGRTQNYACQMAGHKVVYPNY